MTTFQRGTSEVSAFSPSTLYSLALIFTFASYRSLILAGNFRKEYVEKIINRDGSQAVEAR
jgi:hypothetical protein